MPNISLMMVVNQRNPYVRLCYSCSGQNIPPENWDFLMDDGLATLRLELQGDMDGCGTMCTAINGIERVTVKVDFVPLGGAELALWGAMKSVYR